MSLNKIFKSHKKSIKKVQEEQVIRLESVIEEIQEVCKKRQVSHYELLDILNNMQFSLNNQIAKMMIESNKKINFYKEEFNKRGIILADNDKGK